MAEPETDLEPVVTEHVNPRDAVNDDVRAAIAGLRGDEPPEVAATPEVADEAAPAVVKGDHPTDPNRYSDGTFKSAKTEAAPAVAAPVEKLPATEEQAKASAAPSTAPAPPVSWAAEAKQAWASLPPAIQTAVLKREQEASAGFAQYSEKTKAYERALAPVAQEAQRFGLNVEDGIKRLLDGQRFLETQPAQAILWLAQKHGLDLAEIASNPPAPQAPVRSEATVPPQFVQEISSLKEQLNGFLVDQNMSAVQQFAEKNAHYADVEDQLPAIMREIQAADPLAKGVPLLQAAYDRAIWLNETVREKMLADRLAQTQQTAMAKTVQKHNQATRAAVSIKGSSADTRPPAKPQMNGSGHPADDVRAAIAQLRAGV
jgi:hypothetical protein